MYFDSDDMYALYFAWSKPWSQVIHENLFFWQGGFRPLGAFFYRGLFAAVGYTPLPFRIAELSFCLVDTAICFWIVKEISESLRAAALATLLFAFHSRMIEVWYRTTIIFDVLCFLFVWLAFGVYIQARKGGKPLTLRRGAAILAVVFLRVGFEGDGGRAAAPALVLRTALQSGALEGIPSIAATRPDRHHGSDDGGLHARETVRPERDVEQRLLHTRVFPHPLPAQLERLYRRPLRAQTGSHRMGCASRSSERYWWGRSSPDRAS